jgi:hypothetical protein
VDSDTAYGDHDEDRPDLPRPDLVRRVREICLALPEVTERPSHGSPAFFVRDRKQFVMLWPDGHHDNRFPHLWCAAPPGSQAELIAAAPERFFRPPYVGGRGWIGVRLPGGDTLREDDARPGGDALPEGDARPPGSDSQPASAWAEIAELCQDAYRAIAPAKLIALLNG